MCIEHREAAMPIGIDLDKLAEVAAERLRSVTRDRRLAFYQITAALVRGSGVTNPDQLRNLAKRLRQRMREHNARKRSAAAAGRRRARELRDLISP